MKANEAPKKIYLYPSDRADEEYEEEWGDLPWGEDYIEYTRTDAFIEKAENFLKMLGSEFTITDNIIHSNYGKEQLIENFKNYMKGE